MTDREKANLLRRAIRDLKGDDLERAEYAFTGYSPEQMQRQHGQSGRTRQEIIDEYREDRQRVNAAGDFLETMLKERGL